MRFKKFIQGQAVQVKWKLPAPPIHLFYGYIPPSLRHKQKAQFLTPESLQSDLWIDSEDQWS